MILRLDNLNIEDKRVVMLNSGGLDTCYVASYLNYWGFYIHHLYVNYGQNSAEQEKKYAQLLCKRYGGTFHEANITLPWLRDSTVLAGHRVGTYDITSALGTVEAKTYVPMRNTVLLSLAGSLAEALDVHFIAAGLDGKQDTLGRPMYGAPDKHFNYAKTLEETLNEGSSQYHVKGKYIELILPVLGNEKEDTIRSGFEIGTDFSLSWTCYNNGDKPCGTCCACQDRAEHFKNLGLNDPIFYKK